MGGRLRDVSWGCGLARNPPVNVTRLVMGTRGTDLRPGFPEYFYLLKNYRGVCGVWQGNALLCLKVF